MNLSRIYAVYIRQWFLIKSNPIRLASSFIWLLISILQWGFISKYLATFGQTTFDLVNVLLGAIILWEVTTRVEQGLMMGFLEDIWRDNFINFFASPLKIKEYLTGLIVNSALMMVIGFIVMIAIAFFFGYNIFAIGLMIFPFILILSMFGVAIGITVTSIIFRYGPAAEWIAWPIPLVLSIISGVFYPISTLPYALELLARLTPSAYVFESMRYISANHSYGSAVWFNLLIGTILVIAYQYLTYRLFINTYRRNLKTGRLARMSAEGD